MKCIVPIFIIGLTGGILDEMTELNKVWCFLLGIGVFYLFVLIKSIFTTWKVMRKTKGANKIWLDQNNNVIRQE